MKRLGSTIAVVLCSVPVFAQGTQADYERALGLRKQFESQIGNVAESATWRCTVADSACRKATPAEAQQGGGRGGVVNQLIKYNENFDLLTIPGAGHTSGGTCGDRKRWDFFVRNLLGVNPPRWSDAMKAASTAAANADDEEDELASPWVTERGGAGY